MRPLLQVPEYGVRGCWWNVPPVTLEKAEMALVAQVGEGDQLVSVTHFQAFYPPGPLSLVPFGVGSGGHY